MKRRSALIYYAWSRPSETSAPLGIIENRFPALFESRRMLYPKLQPLADPARFDQGIGGFLDHILKANYVEFLRHGRDALGCTLTEIERVTDDGVQTGLDAALPPSCDTVIVISFDSLQSGQHADAGEVEALRRFLAHPDHLVCICPHHDIGALDDVPADAHEAVQTAEFLHHGDRTIPPQQRFGGYARSLLAGLGIAVENRFGLHPAAEADGTPAAIEPGPATDRLGLCEGVTTFNLHAHLPHFERLGAAVGQMEVLARQRIDPTATPHRFTAAGHRHFDALLQSRPGLFAGSLLVGDATLWSSTAGGVDSLRRLWTNVLQRPLQS